MYKDPTRFKQKLSLVYLWLVPPVTAAIGFGVGSLSYKIYLPVWGLNACLMICSAYHLGAHGLSKRDRPGRLQAITALLLFLPWLLFPIFAGMGPPPSTVQGWVNTAAEQQIRYIILIVGGILFFSGTALLKTQLQAAGENRYSVIAFAALSIAMPLFIINMAFWGCFLSESFKFFTGAKRPEWFAPIRELFFLISVVEVSLLYLGTAGFAAALKKSGYFSPRACNVYIIISLAGFLLGLIPSAAPKPLAALSYLVSVPAIPFIMPYLIGTNMLRKKDPLEPGGSEK